MEEAAVVVDKGIGIRRVVGAWFFGWWFFLGVVRWVRRLIPIMGKTSASGEGFGS